MPRLYADNPDLWRARAAQARAQAHLISDPFLQARMLSVADNCEELARRAYRRLVDERSDLSDNESASGALHR